MKKFLYALLFIAAVLYYVYFGIPNWHECRDAGFSQSYCLHFLIK